MASALAAGLFGIENGPELSPPIAGNAYEDESSTLLPTNLAETTRLFSNSQAARKYFGNPFVDHFVMTREHESASTKNP